MPWWAHSLIIKQLQASFQTLFCSCFFHLHHNSFLKTRVNIGSVVFVKDSIIGKSMYFDRCKCVLAFTEFQYYLKLKYPIEGLSNSPINIALSSSMFDSSQQVSGNSEQL